MSVLIFTNVVATMPAGGAAVKAEAGWFKFGVIIAISLALLVGRLPRSDRLASPAVVRVLFFSLVGLAGTVPPLLSVLVERESHKAIVIGKQGERLKTVGTEARVEMERLFDMKVFLKLWVKVRESWREDEETLAELGY